MKLEWIGHSCFRMTAADDTVLITDPYDESVGCRMIPLEADIVTMSHAHHDHAETSMLRGQPLILREDTPYSRDGLRITALRSFHDDARGAKRGPNFIRIFEIDGLRIVHMGDQGCMPSPEILSAIKGADVLMLPVGGFYTIDAKQAKALITAAAPGCAVPMHMKTAHCGYPIAPIGDFLSVMGAETLRPVPSAELLPGNCPKGVLLLRPEADTL